jgi:hypothetical protein
MSKPGSSLRDQLRQAISNCDVSVFIATHLALDSSWCLAGIAAFWGAGKPVIVYLADSSLKDEELPPIVQGDVWERRIARVVARAGELVKEARSLSDAIKDSGTQRRQYDRRATRTTHRRCNLVGRSCCEI